MINIWIVLAILLIHYLADFVLQTHYMSINKSKKNSILFLHVWIYTMCWMSLIGPMVNYLNDYTLLWFLPITFVCHYITDYFTSRLNAKLWKENKVHLFFVSVGFDQFLHFAQLLLTYYLLM